jgi:hypothetical protein
MPKDTKRSSVQLAKRSLKLQDFYRELHSISQSSNFPILTDSIEHIPNWEPFLLGNF